MILTVKRAKCWNGSIIIRKFNIRPMKKITLFFTVLLIACAFIASAQKEKKVLVFCKTAKYHHESIPAGIAAIKKLAVENRFAVDVTTDSTWFVESKLKQYAAVVFLNTSGNVLDTAQKIDFQRYIEAGGGYVGIHCASSTEKNWPFYNKLVGAIFTDHPEPQDGTVVTVDQNNPATKQWPARWAHKDEWYNFRNIQPDLNILLKADETSYKGGKNGPDHPLAWYHEYDGGRSFYTALGHFDEFYVDPLFTQHILAGIKYAMGQNVKLDYTRVKTARFKS